MAALCRAKRTARTACASTSINVGGFPAPRLHSCPRRDIAILPVLCLSCFVPAQERDGQSIRTATLSRCTSSPCQSCIAALLGRLGRRLAATAESLPTSSAICPPFETRRPLVRLQSGSSRSLQLGRHLSTKRRVEIEVRQNQAKRLLTLFYLLLAWPSLVPHPSVRLLPLEGILRPREWLLCLCQRRLAQWSSKCVYPSFLILCLVSLDRWWTGEEHRGNAASSSAAPAPSHTMQFAHCCPLPSR